MSEINLCGRRVIVTGASPGSLGFATATALAELGASVVMTVRRDCDAVREALSLNQVSSESCKRIEVSPLDLCDVESVERFSNWHNDRYGDSLDVLVNNAGVHLDLMSQWKSPHLMTDGFETHWRTNFLGTMHLTHRLFPALVATAKQSGETRVVNVVSKLHSMGTNSQLFEKTEAYNSWRAYGLSKLALVHATFEGQRRFSSQEGVQFYCLHPGSVSTNVAAKGLDGTFAGRVRSALLPLERLFLKKPQNGARTSVHCAASPGLAGGLYYKNSRVAQASSEANDEAVASRLWDETAAWVEGLC